MNYKVTFDSIVVELTRRCQLRCEHCFRGEAQDLDISEKIIDDWLKNTEIIGELAFTGGEPTLNLDAMELILKKLYEYRIPLFHLKIITNGYEVSDRFIEIIKEYNELIALCLSVDYPDEKAEKYITVAMSTDKYHTGYAKEKNASLLREKLQGIASFHTTLQGAKTKNDGRGKHLSSALNMNIVPDFPRKVEVLTKNIKPTCPHAADGTYTLLHDDQVMIICDVTLTAKGNVVRFPHSNIEYEREDSADKCIFNVSNSNDWLADILKYNNTGIKYGCCEATQKEQKQLHSFMGIMQCIKEYLRITKIDPDFEYINAYSMIDPNLTDVSLEDCKEKYEQIKKLSLVEQLTLAEISNQTNIK